MGDGPDADAVVTVVGEVELAEHELGVRLHGGQRGLRRQRGLPHDLQVAEVRELHRRVAGDQAGLVDLFTYRHEPSTVSKK